LKKGQDVLHVRRDGSNAKVRLTSVMTYDGLNRVETEAAEPGDIIAVSGIADISIGESITDIESPTPLPPIAIEEPTVKMTFGVNTSPFAGKEGQYTTSRNIKERLERELQTDVALRVEPGESADKFVVSGRGELHLAILIEKMRREGFELQVSRPQVIMKDIDGVMSEPVEQVFIEVPENLSGTVIEKMGKRRGEMKDMKVERGNTYLEFAIPTRGLIGFRNEFLTDTKGLGIINSLFLGYEPFRGEFSGIAHGSIIAYEAGTSITYGLLPAQGRGQLFIGAGVEVYAGIVVGESA
jgi:GTP-binding protein